VHSLRLFFLLEHLITASASPNGSTILQVSPEGTELQEVFFIESKASLSEYCRSGNSACELLVLGNDSTRVYTAFVPLHNGVWIITLLLGGPSVEKVGESTLFFSSCRTVGVFEVYGLFVAVCTNTAYDDLHYCDISVDLTNASSTVNRCGENPDSLRVSLIEGRISNVVQTGSIFREANLEFFSGTTLYRYSVETYRIQRVTLTLDCEAVTHIQLLQRSTGSVYLHCNNTKIYKYNLLLNSAGVPELVRDALEQSYPCRNGSYSITGNEVLYSSPLGNNLTIILSRSVTSGQCIAENSLVYEDVALSVNLINVGQNELRLSVVSTGNFVVLDDLYVVQFDRGTLIITEPTTQAISEFMTSSSSFPPLIFLLSITVETSGVTPTQSMSMDKSTLQSTTPTKTQTTGSTVMTALLPTGSTVMTTLLPTSEYPNSFNERDTTIGVIIPIVFVLAIVTIVTIIAIRRKKCKRESAADPTGDSNSRHHKTEMVVGLVNRKEPKEDLEASPSDNHNSVQGSQQGRTTDVAIDISNTHEERNTMAGVRTLPDVPLEAIKEQYHKGQTEEGINNSQRKINYCTPQQQQ